MSLFYSDNLVEQVYADARYKLERIIAGSGQDLVLIKTIVDESSAVEVRKSLQQEYLLLKKCQSETIIKPNGLENHDDNPILILENFAGQSLIQFLAAQRVSQQNFFWIAIQLTAALEAIHCQGIILRNLKLGGILIDPKSLKLKLVDFSLATQQGLVTEVESKLFAEENVLYIAPEQTGRMNLSADYRADFYSLGILLYQILTGVMPCNTQNSLELIHFHLAQTPPAPHDLDDRISQVISAIIMKLLAKNPDHRYQSASTLKHDLENCQTQFENYGVIAEFELGGLDQLSRFRISPKLYGRSTELKAIAESITRISFPQAPPELILLTGESGMGKTALMKQVISTKISGKGYLVKGKFEQLNGSIPYQGIIQALRELIQQLLSDTEANRQLWQERIKKAITSNGRVITNILPELELIIGSQPEIPSLAGKESRNRFNTVFIEFLQVFAQPKCPLILFLDDLQWADSNSLTLLELLLSDYKSRNLLIVGAYRDVEEDHYLNQAIAQISQTVKINQISLEPLTIEAITCLLADTLDCNSKELLPLVQLLQQRTHGNPFLLNLLLQSFYQKKLLTFDFKSLSWRWSLTDLCNTFITDDSILDLVWSQLNRLPDCCLQILQVAACIGHQFELTMLTNVYNLYLSTAQYVGDSAIELDQEALIQKLNNALQAGIITLAP